MEPDFRAYEDFLKIDWSKKPPAVKIPSHVAGKNFLFIDLSTISSSEKIFTLGPESPLEKTPQQKKAMGDIAGALFTHFSPTKTEYKKENFRNSNAAESIIEGLSNKAILSGGGFAHQTGVIIFDPIAADLGTIVGLLTTGQIQNKPILSKEIEDLHDTYVKNHEAAHAMLDLKEAGADFFASAISLKQNPNAAKMLEIVADTRNVGWIYEPDSLHSQHGEECAQAIKYALHMNPDDLKKMSIQDIYKIAKYFDNMTLKNALNPHSTEDRVLEELQSSPQRDFFKFMSGIVPKEFRKIFRDAVDNIEEKTIFPPAIGEKLKTTTSNIPEDSALLQSMRQSYIHLNRLILQTQ